MSPDSSTMRNFISNIGAFVAGTVSFALTVALVLGVQRAIDLNLFSLMWWAVIPIGAFMTGLLAASGYYVAAIKFNVKPGRSVAVGMLAVAALVQVALYYSQYSMAVTEDGQAVSALVSFPRFVGWTLSHSKYGLIVHGYRPGGPDGGLEIGFLGYVVAVLQFLALVAGGVAVYAILAEKPYCEACSKFLRTAYKAQVPFAGGMDTVDTLRTTENASRNYFEQLRTLPQGNTAALELELSSCPSCAREALAERPMFIKEGKLAYQGDAYRTSWLPAGTSVADEVARLASLSPAR